MNKPLICWWSNWIANKQAHNDDGLAVIHKNILKHTKIGNYSNIEGINSLIDSMSFPNHSNNDSIIKYDTY